MKDLTWQVLIAHAKGEEGFAEQLAEPIRQAGYQVAHRGTVMVGESFTEEASKVLSTGGSVVLCGTIKALGTKWARQIVNAARQTYRTRVFCVQMEEEADVEVLTFDECVAQHWQNSTKAMQDLIASLKKYYPLQESSDYVPMGNEAEQRYRELALESCDIIDLANLPESDRHIATQKLALRRLYVALRVHVEIASSAEADEVALHAHVEIASSAEADEVALHAHVEIAPSAEADEAEFETIEKRRNALQRQLAGWGKADGDEWKDKGNRVPIGERLAKARRLVVLGDPGAGKTTMVRWIATAYLLKLTREPDWKALPDVSSLPDEDWLPIIVRCRDLDLSSLSGSLDDILGHTLRKAEMTDAECAALRELLRKKLREGEALLLLDGLDEITDPRVRVGFCRQIERIQNAYSKAPIIATSRIVGYREMGYRLPEFEHVTVADLSREDKDDFARRWCEVTELPERQEDATQELILDIHSVDRIERLTGNPMLLTTMALVKRKVGKLPSRRADLYWEAVQVLLNWRREVDEPIDHREAIPQLEFVAYAMCDRGVQQLRQDEIVELLEQMRQEYPRIHMVREHTPEEFLRLLERRTGILVEAGHVRHHGIPVPVFEFRHLTFQEYLAGRALVDRRFPNRNPSLSLAEYVAPLAARMSEVQDAEKDTEVAVTENWREALRLCVASCNDDDVDDVLQAILKPLEGENSETNARPRAVLAALCLADEPNASEKVAQEVLRDFVGHIGEKDGNKPREIQTSLEAAAMELAVSRWAKILCLFLMEEYQKRKQISYINAGLICGKVAITPLLKAEETIPDWCMEQVFRIGSSEAASSEVAWSICVLAVEDKVPPVPEILDRLKSLLASNSRRTVQAAAFALLALDQIENNGWQPTSAEVERLIFLIGDSECDSLTVIALSYILNNNSKGEHAVASLIAKLDDSHKDVRQAVASALGQIKDERAVTALIAKLKDSDKDVQRAVAQSLGQIGDERAVAPLIAKLDDSHKNVKRAVEEVLVQLGHEQTIKTLLGRLSADIRYMRVAALRALSRTCEDEIDRKLLSRDLDAFNPFLDPQKKIDEKWVRHAAKSLKMPVEEVRNRYQALAQKFSLKLSFSTDAP